MDKEGWLQTFYLMGCGCLGLILIALSGHYLFGWF